MVASKKITKREWDKYIEPQMHAKDFTTREREALRAAFKPHFDLDPEDRRAFGRETPGIGPDEVEETLKELRDRNSDLSKGLDVQLHKNPERLDEFEKIAKEALEGNKESRWF